MSAQGNALGIRKSASSPALQGRNIFPRRPTLTIALEFTALAAPCAHPAEEKAVISLKPAKVCHVRHEQKRCTLSCI
jgi:hypothetical protein